ncbi:MAG: hypothetical protein AAGC88_17750 [Bacteroidota bacterium]
MPKNLNVRRLFLLDGIGAVLTASMLGLLLPQLEEYIGMPKQILMPLAMAVCCYGLYSFTCYVLFKSGGHSFLKVIAIANGLYCLITLGLIIYLWYSLTPLGIIYFLGEVIIILALVRLEWNKAKAI